MMSTSTIMKISHQGQIRIPKKIMLSLGIEKGDYLEVDIHENQMGVALLHSRNYLCYSDLVSFF
jgi:AbrB family looped-hinge helix DNA binding protein